MLCVLRKNSHVFKTGPGWCAARSALSRVRAVHGRELAHFGHPLLSVASTVTFWFQRGKWHGKPSEVQPRSDPHLLHSCLSDC